MEAKVIFLIGVISLIGVQLAFGAEQFPNLDKKSYLIGQWPEITILDSSKNFDAGTAETITATIQSDSEAAKQITLTETGPNTATFSAKIRLSSSPGNPAELYVKDGDSIHVIYRGFINTASVTTGTDTKASLVLVSTDKSEYKVGEIIVISGSVSGGNALYDVNLSIVDPHGNVIHTEAIDLSYVLSYSTEINTENTGWSDSGNYKVLVWHQSEDNSAEVVFSLSSTYGKQETDKKIKIFNSNVFLDYKITSGKINILKADLEKNSLIFSIDVSSGGHLTVELPRHVMDSTDEDGDVPFTVLMDDRGAESVEKANPNERTLTIPYIHNTKKLEIQGTLLEIAPTIPTATVVIPEWIRNNADWYSKGLIGEGDFLSGIQYLITNGVIQIPLLTDIEQPVTEFVPPWVKNTAGWWAQGLVSDSEFVNALQFLISQGIISV